MDLCTFLFNIRKWSWTRRLMLHMVSISGGRAQGRGTIAYVAPEIVLEGKAGFGADVYALGVTVW